jgi:hypothetical protein
VEDQQQQSQQQSTQQATEQARIVNFPRRVSAFGKEYEVKELTLGPMIRALPHIAPLGYLLRAATKTDATDLLVNALALSGEPAIGLLSVITEEPVEWLEDKDPIDGLELLTAHVEANVHYFFDSANLERIKNACARLGKVVEEHAPKPNSGAFSTSSSVADTAP